MSDLERALKLLSFKCLAVQASLKGLKEETILPCILHWEQHHYVVLYEIENGWYYVSDPAFGKVKLKEEEFRRMWLSTDEMGIALVLKPKDEFFEKVFPYEEKLQINKRLFSFVGSITDGQRSKLIKLGLIMLLSSVLIYIFPYTMRVLIDKGIKYKQVNILFYILFFQMFLFFGQAIFEWLKNVVRIHFSMNVSTRMLSQLLNKIISLPISFFDSRLQTDILQKIDEQEKIERFLSLQLVQSLFSIILIIALTVQLLISQTYIGIIFLSLSALSITWSLLFYNKRRANNYYTFNLLSENRNHIQEMVAGMVAIKINNSQNEKVSSWKKIYKRLFDLKIKGLSIDSYQNLGVTLINQFKTILITIYCAWCVIKGSLTLGDMLSIGYIAGLLSQPIDTLFNSIKSFQDAKLAYDRVDEIHKKPSEYTAPDPNGYPPIDSDIRLTAVSFRYAGGNSPLILKNLDIVIPHGKVTAIVGASGSGKTTLLKLLMKFYRVESGHLELGDYPFEQMDANWWRDQIGVVMQDGYIFSGTIGQNICMNEESPDEDKLKEATRIACIDDYVNSLPLKYNTMIGNAGADLSGGQRQRILIARAVYKDPKFIFFDEATSSLDAKNEAQIISNLNNFFSEKTVVIIAHRLSTVKKADQIIVLNDGNAIEIGTHESLTYSRSMYYDLVKNQLELES
jgi:ATP-binding cassette subfamily B protein